MGTSAAGRRRSVKWTRFAAWLLLGLGLAVATGSAVLRYSVVQEQETATAEATAVNVRTIVATQLARQDDLLYTLAGVVSAVPDLSNAQFADWYAKVQVAERFPGGVGIAYIERVPADRLAAFSAQQTADPVTGLPSLGRFSVVPDHEAVEYCLTRLGVWEVSEVAGFPIPAGLDFCSPEMTPGIPSSTPEVLAYATDEASPALVPLARVAPGVLAEFLPVYAGGDVPATIEERRARVLGWVAASFDADVLADLAVAGQPDLAVVIDRSTPAGVERVAQGGDVSGSTLDGETLPVSADGTWTVTVSQKAVQGSQSAGVQAAFVLVGAVVLTLLLFALIRVLGGSRERAMAMVEEKTAQLEYQALHDSLTGLPSRALILDRATQMLARQARAGGAVAALFVDLDEFKAVNDRYGHAAGDAFLCAVADRIDSLFRGSDTVGRLGGDEFVVLLEGDLAADGAGLAAQRVLDVLADPIELDGIAVPVSCSVGVAIGPRASADDLLRDADTAMYQAKSAGKGRFVVFSDVAGGEPPRGRGVRSGA